MKHLAQRPRLDGRAGHSYDAARPFAERPPVAIVEGDAGLTAAELATMPALLRVATRPGIVDLAMGIDAAPPAQALPDAVVDAMRAGHHHYVDAAGLPALRAAWAASIAARCGLPVDADGELTITAGGSGGVFCALLALGCAGRPVLVFDPGYALHVGAVEAIGGRVVRVPRAPQGWGIDLDRLERALAERPRALLMADPCNPTGAVTPPAVLADIAFRCARRGVALIVDEAYADLVFDGPQPGAWRLRETGVELVVVRSLSKSHRISGWRVGAALAAGDLSARLRAVHTVSTLGVPSPLQYGALAAFGAGRDHLPAMRAELRVAQAQLVDAFRAVGARIVPAAGGMFLCADISATPAADDLAFVRWLYSAAGLLVAPGRLFFADEARGRRHVRICFARTPAVISAAAAQLERLAGRPSPGRGPTPAEVAR